LRPKKEEWAMRSKRLTGILAVLISAPAVMAAPAFAQDGYYDSQGRYVSDDSGRHYSDDDGRIYRGRDHYYHYRCDGGDGVVGTVGGGVGGALIGNALGGGAGLILGGLGGALLGRHLDKENTRDKAGC
jgi:hypothetical protein